MATVNLENFSTQFDCFKHKGLHMLHLNTRSLLDKITELRDIATQSRAAISGVSETWLDGTVTNSESELEGYNIIRQDRDRHGGGGCTFIRYDIAFSERTDLNNLKLEAVWCDILLPKTKPIIVGTCYRPPKQNDFIDIFESVLFPSDLTLNGTFWEISTFVLNRKKKKQFCIESMNSYVEFLI